jgi:hypothetical protein
MSTWLSSLSISDWNAICSTALTVGLGILGVSVSGIGGGARVQILLVYLQRYIIPVTFGFIAFWIALFAIEKREVSSIEADIRASYGDDQLSSKTNVEIFNQITNGMSRHTNRADFDVVLGNMLASKKLFSRLECAGRVETPDKSFLVELYTIVEPMRPPLSSLRC